MSFDPMAAAMDWLEAYRARDIEAILKMYADNAIIECGCGGMKTITGKDSLRAYWQQRLKDYPASELDDLQTASAGATVAYRTPDGVIGATLEFDPDGRIRLLQCRPLS